MSRNNVHISSKPHTSFSENSFWQSTLWADILSSTGQAEVIPYASWDIQILIERRKIWRHMTGLYILGIDGDILSSDILDDIRHEIVSPSDLFLQIEPIWWTQAWSGWAPFRRFLEPKTAILPLTGMTEESLIHRFEEKGRYNIRVAQRRWLSTHWVSGESLSPYSLPWTSSWGMTNTELFFSLLRETTERDKFSHNSLSYYRHFLSILEKNHAGGLLFVTKDDTLHAAGIFVYTEKQGIYYYGASPNSQEIRRDHGTYLLQWEAMCEALRRGCSEYDFLGISSQPGDKLAGVTAFKMRFAPDSVSLPLETVIVFKPITLFVLRMVSKIRKLLK